MPTAFLPDLRLQYLDEGPRSGPPLILLHPLGLDLAVWDDVIANLDPGLRIIRHDHRGHGKSDIPPAPYTMGALVRDTERLLDHLGVKGAVCIGPGMGGLVAQGLAVKRLDQIRGLVLSNTAARIGHATHWQARQADVRAHGMTYGIDARMARLFSRQFLATGAALRWREKLLACDVEGYAGCAAAMAHADFYTPTAGLTLPTLVIACNNDAVTPPDLVRETADLVAGSRFHLMRGPGHLPYVEAPTEFAGLVMGFLHGIGHLSAPSDHG